MAATLDTCDQGSWRDYLAGVNVVENLLSVWLICKKKPLKTSVMFFDPFDILRDDHISHCLTNLFFLNSDLSVLYFNA